MPIKLVLKPSTDIFHAKDVKFNDWQNFDFLLFRHQGELEKFKTVKHQIPSPFPVLNMLD